MVFITESLQTKTKQSERPVQQKENTKRPEWKISKRPKLRKKPAAKSRLKERKKERTNFKKYRRFDQKITRTYLFQVNFIKITLSSRKQNFQRTKASWIYFYNFLLGKQSRRVLCTRKDDGSYVEDKVCLKKSKKPAEEQYCNTHPCDPQ